jgi:prophage regulatory protein
MGARNPPISSQTSDLHDRPAINAAVRLIRLPEVRRLTGLSRSSIYRLQQEGKFVARYRLGDRASAYRLDHVMAWIEARPLARETAPIV